MRYLECSCGVLSVDVYSSSVCCGSQYLDWFVVFFFKQNTAYEMRISDWSSDVCSSDLLESGPRTGFKLPKWKAAGIKPFGARKSRKAARFLTFARPDPRPESGTILWINYDEINIIKKKKTDRLEQFTRVGQFHQQLVSARRQGFDRTSDVWGKSG